MSLVEEQIAEIVNRGLNPPMRQQAENLLLVAGERVRPFEGSRAGPVIRVLAAAFAYKTARDLGLPVRDIVDSQKLTRRVNIEERDLQISLWSDYADVKNSPSLWLGKGIGDRLQLTSNGPVLITYETRLEYPRPNFLSNDAGASLRPEYVGILVDRAPTPRELSFWQNALDGLARAAFR
jgi:hypothetical protein